MESLEEDDSFRTRSDEDVFAETLPARLNRRRSSFPLESMASESDDREETISLCDKNLLSLRECSKHISTASSTGALPSSKSTRTNYPTTCRHLLPTPFSHVAVGSTLSLANHRHALYHHPENASPLDPPKQKWYRLLQQTCVQFGLDFSYAMAGALVTPILLQLGLPERLYGLAWFLAPILGFILAPLIGSASDRCHSPMGQRRPFILVLGIGVIIGTGLFLNSAHLGTLISQSNAAIWGIAICVLGVVLADFSADSCNSPFKAYLMERSSLDDLKRALSMRCIHGGIGGGLGFICVGINWDETSIGQAFGSQVRVIFFLNTIVFIITLILTLTSVPEVRLRKSPSSTRRTKYIACKQNESDTRTTKRTGEKTHKSNKALHKTCTSILCFLRKCSIFRKTKPVDVVREENGGERCETACLSNESKDEEAGTKHESGEFSHKGTTNGNSLSHGTQSNARCKEDGSGRTKGNGRRYFIPKKKVKGACSVKKSGPGGVPSGSCVVKVSLNDETKDLLIGVAKINGGQFQQNGGVPLMNGISSTTAICVSSPSVEINCGDDDEGGESDDDDDKNKPSHSFLGLLKSAVHMPKELRYLSLTNFFSWGGVIMMLCFYTDFVAQAVYHGDPSAPMDSEEYLLYEEGVQMGSWGLCIYAFFSSIVGLVMPALQRYVSQKCIYVSCQLIFAAGCGAMALLTDHVYVVLALCVTLGLNCVIVMTIPHNVLASYHKSEKYKNPEGGLPRGLGTDMACIDCQVFLSQITISAVMGPLIELTGSHITIMVSAALMSLLASIFACFLVTYEIKEN